MANLSYEINPSHSITINDVQTGSKRYSTSTAPEELVTEFEKLQRVSLKNVLGISYRFRQNQKWNINVFGKISKNRWKLFRNPSYYNFHFVPASPDELHQQDYKGQ